MSNRLYIQNRLYNVNDRLAALSLYERIEQWIQEKTLVDMETSYLPFKTTNNTGVDSEDGIFEMDEKALSSCSGVVGYFDGWTYDPGCAFELGCGYAWGYPIHLITTDIFKSSVGDSQQYYWGSKLLEHISTIVAVNDLNQNITDYRKRNEDVLERAIEAFKQNLIREYGQAKPKPEKLCGLPPVYDYYIDPNFKYSEPARMLLKEITSMLEYAGKSYTIGNNQDNIDDDLLALRQSKSSIFLFDVAEPNVDSGILQGFAYGIGQKPLVYASNVQRIMMSGRFKIQLNTMNYWCAKAVVSSLDELKEHI